MSDAKTGKLPAKVKIGFGICDLGGNLFFTMLLFWAMKYLTDTVLLPAAVAGFVIMIGKLWDAFADPVMGYISDRTKSKWGRRRPYIFWGSIPLCLTIIFFFTNPHIADPTLLAIWAGVAFALMNTAYTVVNIPYSSLTPELTKDYKERSSLNGYRFFFAVIGTLLGGVAVQPIVTSFGLDTSVGFAVVGVIFGIIIMVTAMTTGLTVKELPPEQIHVPKTPFLKTYLSVFKCKPFLTLLFTYGLHIAGISFLATIIPYYFTYLYGDSGMGTIATGILLIVAMIFIPISVIAANKYGKKRCYQFCFLVLSISCLGIFFLGHLLGPIFFLALMVFAGVGMGFSYVAPYAMVPDAIEVDAVETGARKEGSFYAMWTWMSKIGQALSAFILGGILTFSGYIEPHIVGVAMAQSPETLFGIRLLIGPVPVLFLLGAMFLMQRYKLDEKAYAEIMKKAEGKA